MRSTPACLRDILEMPVAVVLKQNVAAADRGDEQILVAVVVDIRERRGHADAAGQSDAGFLRDVPELATAQVFPEFVAAELIHEIDVVQAIAIDVRDRDAVAMVVVAHPHVLGDVVNGVVDEGDPAFF